MSFSLLKSWKGVDQAGGLDYPLYWRRALLGATASHVLARTIGIKDGEELFRACLIQDIGVMADTGGALLAEIGRMIPDAESVFETKLLSTARSEAILAEARGADAAQDHRASASSAHSARRDTKRAI